MVTEKFWDTGAIDDKQDFIYTFWANLTNQSDLRRLRLNFAFGLIRIC